MWEHRSSCLPIFAICKPMLDEGCTTVGARLLQVQLLGALLALLDRSAARPEVTNFAPLTTIAAVCGPAAWCAASANDLCHCWRHRVMHHAGCLDSNSLTMLEQVAGDSVEFRPHRIFKWLNSRKHASLKRMPDTPTQSQAHKCGMGTRMFRIRKFGQVAHRQEGDSFRKNQRRQRTRSERSSLLVAAAGSNGPTR